MHSTIEYIRQLNQNSVAVQSSWLDRLKHVDAGPDAAVALPEIILASGEEQKAIHTRLDAPAAHTVGRPVSSNVTDDELLAESKPSVADAQTIAESCSTDLLCSADSSSYSTCSTTHDASEITDAAVAATRLASNEGSAANSNQQRTIRQPEQELPSPAVLDGIVRPTIVPLRRKLETDVLSPHDTEKQVVSAVSQSSEETIAPRRLETISDFGLSAREMQENETIPAEELHGITPTPAESVSAFDARSAAETVMYPEPGEDNDATPLRFPVASFPADSRGERFVYSAGGRQKLVDTIVRQIEERFPAGSHSTIMLLSPNREIDIDSATSRIATCLACCDKGQILLVDGNLQSGQLTTVLGLSDQPGISDAFVANASAIKYVAPTDNPQLHVLGTGGVSPDAGTSFPVSSTTNKSLKERYDYTLVSGGVVGDSLADVWCGIVDAVYLVVDMDESDQTTTAAAVDYIRKIGGRLVGCIATRA